LAEYRAFFVGNGGHFAGFEPLVCAHDAEAIEKAECFVDSYDVELWSGPRLVARLSHSKKKASTIGLTTPTALLFDEGGRADERFGST
jgi:hypothetical protein